MSRSRILIVEQLRSRPTAYPAQLEKAGYECVVADSGAAALQVMASLVPIHAMLLDLELPDSDGLQLLRNDPSLARRIPVVVATTELSMAWAIEAMRLGAFDFLVKPVAPDRLAAVIASAAEAGRAATLHAARQPDSLEPASLSPALRGLTLDQIERIAVKHAIEREGGSLPAAARALGVSPSTLYRKRERWAVEEGGH